MRRLRRLCLRRCGNGRRRPPPPARAEGRWVAPAGSPRRSRGRPALRGRIRPCRIVTFRHRRPYSGQRNPGGNPLSTLARLRLRTTLVALAALSAAWPALAGSVSGRVLDAAGKPVAGAAVKWFAYRTDDQVRLDQTSG